MDKAADLCGKLTHAWALLLSQTEQWNSELCLEEMMWYLKRAITNIVEGCNFGERLSR